MRNLQIKYKTEEAPIESVDFTSTGGLGVGLKFYPVLCNENRLEITFANTSATFNKQDAQEMIDLMQKMVNQL
jgi:hypothetical protein